MLPTSTRKHAPQSVDIITGQRRDGHILQIKKGYPLSSTTLRNLIIYTAYDARCQARLSPHLGAISRSVCDGGSVRGISGAIALAERVCVLELRQHDSTVPRQPSAVDLQGLPASEHRDRRHDL